MGVRLFPAVHGHIADSVRDHGRGPVAHSRRIARGGEAEAGRSPNRLLLDFYGPQSSVKSPSDSWKITGGSRVWPTCGPLGSTGSRENAAVVGVSLWNDHAGRQAAPACSAEGLQDATSGRHRFVAAEWPIGHVCGTCYAYVRKHPAPAPAAPGRLSWSARIPRAARSAGHAPAGTAPRSPARAAAPPTCSRTAGALGACWPPSPGI
jgi:hypothetical protein